MDIAVYLKATNGQPLDINSKSRLLLVTIDKDQMENTFPKHYPRRVDQLHMSLRTGAVEELPLRQITMWGSGITIYGEDPVAHRPASEKYFVAFIVNSRCCNILF